VAKQFTLAKQERLKSRKLIEQLFDEGKNFTVNPFRIYYLLLPLPTTHLSFTIQFGAGVSTKNFKRAVDRNRIKRITREAYRLQKLPLQEKLKEKKIRLNVFFIYTGKELPSYKEVYDTINLSLTRLDKIVNEVN
jgi:ribonuclease P protein component